MVFGGDKDGASLFNMDLITGSWGVESQGVNVAQVGAPFNCKDQNGSFRLYTVTQSHNLPIQIDTYGIMNITQAS